MQDWQRDSLMQDVCGHLSYLEFQQAVQLFAAWWQRSLPEQPCWTLEDVKLPVTEQVIEYALLERVVSAHTGASNGLAAATAAAGAGADAQADAAATAEEPNRSYNLLCGVSKGIQATAAAMQATTAAETAADDTPEDDAVVEDDAAVHAKPSAQQQQQQPIERHVHQYSIVYHDTYQVPVLFIKAFKADGLGLTLAELLHDLPGLQQYKEPGQADWTYVTEMSHPLLRSPCFMIHPCQTATRMELLMQDAAAAAAMPAAAPQGPEQQQALKSTWLLQYMQAWFSMVAGLLGITILPVPLLGSVV